MAVVALPVRTDAPHYEFTTDLDGVTFTLEFRWNDRANGWFVEIRDVNGVRLLSGRRVVVSLPLRARQLSRRPHAIRARLHLTRARERGA